MPYPDEDDYRRMLDLAVAVLESRHPDEVWRSVAQELLRALGGAVLLVKDGEWTPSGGTVGAWLRDAPGPVEPDGDTARLIRSGYPFAGHYGPGGDRFPRTAARLAGERAWRHSETAGALRRSFGTRHALGLPFPDGEDAPGDGTPAGAVRGLMVFRPGADFGTRELRYAARVQPLLAAAAAHHRLLAERWHGGPRPQEPDGAGGLTPRETAVLLTLAEGLPATAMARRLGVSVRTVHKHLQNLYRKLGTADRLGTVLRAQELGLLPPAPRRRTG
ncbi:response regulator transcription factor [Streptomyces sp. NPDC015131]|uniref:helix-turn-helix transcriptional regulator n=1 Tax=Streptomyces sp. NPDC015131 TaxID=3364941 RepID=UPI0037002169